MTCAYWKSEIIRLLKTVGFILLSIKVKQWELSCKLSMPVACLVFFTNLTLSFDGPVHLNSARKEKGPPTFQNCFRYKSTSPKTYLTDQENQETKMVHMISEETIKLSWNLRNSDQPNFWQMMAMHGWHALTGYQNHFAFFSHLVLVFQTYGTNYFPINV